MNAADSQLNTLSTLGDGKARKSLLGLLENTLVDLGWSSSDIFGIQMAVEESVSNAYSHGNKNGDLGDVEIKWKVTDSDFMMEVHDQGEGFAVQDVADPTAPENLENLDGRGLLLIRNFMNEVDIRDGGRTVVLRKSKLSSKAE